MSSLRIETVHDRGALRRFVDLPRALYRDDPLFVPPMTHQEVADLDPTRSPFFRRADIGLWMAHRANAAVGRVAAVVDHLSLALHGDATGMFGYFEADDREVAAVLLDVACRWLAQRGIRRVRGPIDLSTNHRCGCLVTGFDIPPSIMMGHNPPEYAAWFESFGLVKARDLLVFIATRDTVRLERFARLADVTLRRAGVTQRILDLRRFRAEVLGLYELYNRCWERNWGFTPMTAAEFLAQGRSFRPIVRPRWCRILEQGQRAVGFILGLPDINPAIKACDGRLLPFGAIAFLRALKRTHRARVVTLGLLPEVRGRGLDAALIAGISHAMAEDGMQEAELSWVLEDNLPMIKPILELTGPARKVYRLYEKPIAP